MRIGILTLPLHINYGGILQAYALQTILERMGHDVVVFNRKSGGRFLPINKWYIYIKRLIKKILIDNHTEIFYEIGEAKRRAIVGKHTATFTRKYVKTYPIKKLKEIKENNYDAIIVGSDQIWRYAYTVVWSKNCADVFLSFAKDWEIKRYAYSTSFGVDRWEYPKQITPVLAILAQKFNAISVREDSGIELCKSYLNVDAEHVLDPTMLLDVDDYRKLFEDVATPKSKGNFLCYVLDNAEEKQELINKISFERGLTPFNTYIKDEKDCKTIEDRIYPPIENWLRGFYDAEFVITDSFHGCIFSIVFNKPFVAIGNSFRGLSRMQSLVRMFGIEENLLLDVKDYSSYKSYALPSSVKQRLMELRKKSMDFLTLINEY